MADREQPAFPPVTDNRRIAIVGHCAAGKSTLANLLRDLGYNAIAVGQEHSGVRRLWEHVKPDVLVMLDLDLETLRARRGATWSGDIYNRQRERLKPAFSAADLVIDTGTTSAHESRVLIETYLRIHPVEPTSSA